MPNHPIIEALWDDLESLPNGECGQVINEIRHMLTMLEVELTCSTDQLALLN